MADWHSVVYGGIKPEDTGGQTSRNVQCAPEATGRAESVLPLAVDEHDVKRCNAKIDAMRAAGYSWQRIANIGAVAKGTAWHYGNGVTPDPGFIERIMSWNTATVRLTPVCPIHGVVHDAGPCATDTPVAAVVVLAPGETVRRPSGRQRPRVRRCWMGAELTAEMDKAGVTDATVRWLVTRYIYEKELAGPVPGEGNEVQL